MFLWVIFNITNKHKGNDRTNRLRTNLLRNNPENGNYDHFKHLGIMTNLENRVIDRMEYLDYLEITPNDLYAICINICNGPGEHCNEEQIDEEIHIFYNA